MQVWTPNTPLQNGQYIIKKVIGGGGFGETYLADDTEENRQVVIKTLNREQRQKPDFAERQKRFRKEAIDLSKCYHPHIVQVYDNFAEDGLWAIVMEYIDGSDLELYTDNYTEEHGYLSETEALRYIDQIGLALECVHERGLLHRDVKPSNIMLRRQSKEAVLIDFGLAREFQPGKIRSMTAKQTQGYAPIEQYQERKNNPGYEHLKPGYYTDVYALAATLYFILTTRSPLPSLALVESGYPLVNPKEKFNPKISDKVNAAILKGMEILPQNRPQTVREFRELLGLVKPVVNIPTPPPVNYNTIPVQQKPPQNIPTPQRVNHPEERRTPPPNPHPASEEGGLKSSCGMDYRKLRDLLAQGKWQEADRETARVMLAVMKREGDCLYSEHIDNFPCEDLLTIDQLWVKYSNGRFGFSVQNKIYQSLGGTKEEDQKIWEAFGDVVGWTKEETWAYEIKIRSFLDYRDITFNIKAPIGHLPLVSEWLDRCIDWDGEDVMVGGWMGALGGWNWDSQSDLYTRLCVFSRIETCYLSNTKSEIQNSNLSPLDDIKLISAVGLDYRKLRDLLAQGKWQEADEETLSATLAVTKREKEGWLDVESIDNFPCEDLRTIDQLWVKYSDSKFGFSVQKRIYQGLGGTREYNSDIWEKFGDKIGWRKAGGWLYEMEDITFDKKAPEGHLPVSGLCGWDDRGGFLWDDRGGVGFVLCSSLASRLVSCNI